MVGTLLTREQPNGFVTRARDKFSARHTEPSLHAPSGHSPRQPRKLIAPQGVIALCSLRRANLFACPVAPSLHALESPNGRAFVCNTKATGSIPVSNRSE